MTSTTGATTNPDGPRAGLVHCSFFFFLPTADNCIAMIRRVCESCEDVAVSKKSMLGVKDCGVKERCKKKLARRRLKWAGRVERMGDENWQRDQIPRLWREARMTENAVGGLR